MSGRLDEDRRLDRGSDGFGYDDEAEGYELRRLTGKSM